MSKYILTRNRAYWVKETANIEADSIEEAEDKFFNEFDVDLSVGDVFDFKGNQFEYGFSIEEIENGQARQPPS